MSFCLQSIDNVLLSRIKGGMGCSHDQLLTRTNGYLVSNRQPQDKPNRAEPGSPLPATTPQAWVQAVQADVCRRQARSGLLCTSSNFLHSNSHFAQIVIGFFDVLSIVISDAC